MVKGIGKVPLRVRVPGRALQAPLWHLSEPTDPREQDPEVGSP